MNQTPSFWYGYILDGLDLRSQIRRRFVPSQTFYPDPGHITKAVLSSKAIQLLFGNDDLHQEKGFSFCRNQVPSEQGRDAFLSKLKALSKNHP